MQQYLKNIFQQSHQLTVFPLQTGSGKSYSIAKVLSENMDNDKFPQAFIISPLWKLLHSLVKDLKRQAGENHASLILEVYQNEKIWYEFFTKDDNVSDLLRAIGDDYDRDVVNEIRDRYRELSALKSGDDDDKFYNLLNKDIELPNLKKRLRTCLRKCVFADYQKDGKTSFQERCEKCLSQFPFLASLYPELSFHRYKIICLTASKLHKNNFNILDGEVVPYWDYIPENSIVIFDESDQCKSWGKKSFEDEVLEKQGSEDEDKWSLYHRLIKGVDDLLQRYSSPEDAIHQSTIQKLYKELKQEIDKRQNRLKLQPNLSGQKLDSFQGGIGVIYHDMDAISADNKRQLVIEHDANLGHDYLIALEQPEAESERNNRLQVSYADYGITIFFKNFMRKLGTNIIQFDRNEQTLRQSSTGGNYVAQTREQILRELLDAMGIQNENDIRILRSYEGRKGDSFQPKKGMYMRSIYKDGITITEVKEKNGSRRSCKLKTMYLSNYPEHVIQDLVEKKNCQVLLSSATADIKDPLHNYDFEYLEKEIGSICYPDEESETRIKEYIKSITPHCEQKVTVFPEKITRNDSEMKLKELVKSLKIRQSIVDFLQGDNEYMSAAFINLLTFCRDFSQNQDAHAGLVVTPYAWHNKLSRDNKEAGKEILKRIIDAVCGESTIIPYFLSGDTFEKEQKEACDMLSDNNDAKVICLICYNSGSVGVNYDYVIKGELTGFAVAEQLRNVQNRCNFDSIYIEHPTNYIGLGDDASSNLRACFDISILSERSYIEQSKKIEYIRKLLRRRAQMNANRSNSGFDNTMIILKEIYDTRPYREYCIQQVSQALGRLTRTPISRKTLNLYFDEKIADIIAKSQAPKAATEVYLKAQAQLRSERNISVNDAIELEMNTERQRIQNEYDVWNKNCSKRINTKVRHCNEVICDENSEETLKERDELKSWNETLLRYPEPESLSLVGDIGFFYREADSLPLEKKSATEITKLDIFMRNDAVREYFRKRNFCVESRKGKYQMAESVVQQLYLPRVAEHAFKAIMEKAGISVSDLPKEKYERADWWLNECLYVDVKYWAPTDFEEQSKAEDWSEKAQKCEDGLYVIVNVPKYTDSSKERHFRLENGKDLLVINGLIDISTGEVDQENFGKLIELAKKKS